ncbi:MAG: M23 family metallopeptidase [Deltaproteobacteria bacterium]|nr:M23 family metallopeptidase [Deltaproteobacteria bacterium]
MARAIGWMTSLGLLACARPQAVAVPAPAPLVVVAATPPAPAPASPLAPVIVAANAITIAVAPDPTYIERTDGAQLVNCDLVVRNTSAVAFTLSELEVSVFDRTGALVFRKFVSGNGVSPAITTVPTRELAPATQALILNPLHTFPRDLDLAKLRFTVTYEATAGTQQLTATTEVAPRTFVGKARLALPLRDRLIAWSGHDFLSHHRRWDYVDPRIAGLGFDSNAARYSYDLIPVDARGDMRNGDAAINASWFGFGRPVFAPAAGTIVAVTSDRPDDRQFDMAGLKTDLLVVYGNHIVVEHAPGELSMLAHLKQHSVKVKVGDRVRAGQELAAIGASGSSLMPHLHYQLQTTANGHAQGLPAYFHEFVKHGGSAPRVLARGHVDTGEIVESRAKR